MQTDGAFQYTPGPTFVGFETFSFTVTDGNNPVDAVVGIVVNESAPLAQNDLFWMFHDGYSTEPLGNVLDNDADLDNDDFDIVALNGAAFDAGRPVNLTHGVVTMEANGDFTFEPEPGYVGIRTFKYRIFDGLTTNEATVTIETTIWSPVPLKFFTVGTPNARTFAEDGFSVQNDLTRRDDLLVVTAVNGTSSPDTPIQLAHGELMFVDGGLFTLPTEVKARTHFPTPFSTARNTATPVTIFVTDMALLQ